MVMYRIVRMFQRGGTRTIKSDLTLEEAKAWCRDPETSSSTCKTAVKKAYTKAHGPWFDGYEVMKTKSRRR